MAGVTINLIFSDSGIIKKAWEAKKLTEIEQGREEINLAILGLQTEKAAKGEVCTLEYVYDNIEERVNGLIIDGFKGNPMEKIYVTLRRYQYEIIMDGLVNYIGDGDVSYNEVPDLLIVRDETKTGVDKVTLTITAEVEIGRIEKIITPTGEEKSSSIIYEVTENGEYEFKAVTDKEIETTKKVKISNIRDKNAIDITNLITEGEAEHNHIYESKYDELSHWQQCTICDKKINVENHTIEIIGNPATCDTNIVLGKKVCSKNCGYSKNLTHLAHNLSENVLVGEAGGWMRQVYHWRKCSKCNNVVNEYHTFLVDGKQMTLPQMWEVQIDPHTLGTQTCVVCKDTVDLSKHRCDSNVCYICNKDLAKSIMFNFNLPQNIIQDGILKIDLINQEAQDVYFEVDMGEFETYKSCSIKSYYGGNYQLTTPELVSANGSKYVFKSTVSLIDKAVPLTEALRVTAGISTNIKVGDIVEGYEMISGIGKFGQIVAYPDTTDPTIESLTATSIKESDGWATSKKITVTGTAKLNRIVYISMYDQNENAIFENSAAVVNNGNYTFSIIPNFEVDMAQNFTIKVADMFGNEISKVINLEKIDAKAPVFLNSPSYEESWQKTKEITLEVEENGSGNLQMALNDQNLYEIVTKEEGANYRKQYRFTGDVYTEKEIAIYAKDGLENVTTKKIKMGKLDNTSPIIENVKVENGVLKIQANDVNNELKQEGSGVAEYAISTTKEMPSDTLFQTKSEFNVETGRTYYIWVKDKAGNYSSMYEAIN